MIILSRFWARIALARSRFVPLLDRDRYVIYIGIDLQIDLQRYLDGQHAVVSHDYILHGGRDVGRDLKGFALIVANGHKQLCQTLLRWILLRHQVEKLHLRLVPHRHRHP